MHDIPPPPAPPAERVLPDTMGCAMTLIACILFGLPILTLTACGSTPTVVKEQVRTVSVPVIQKCAAERPAEVDPLRGRVDEAAWQAMTLKQKAETTAAQALRRLAYSDALAAATSAC